MIRRLVALAALLLASTSFAEERLEDLGQAKVGPYTVAITRVHDNQERVFFRIRSPQAGDLPLEAVTLEDAILKLGELMGDAHLSEPIGFAGQTQSIEMKDGVYRLVLTTLPQMVFELRPDYFPGVMTIKAGDIVRVWKVVFPGSTEKAFVTRVEIYKAPATEL